MISIITVTHNSFQVLKRLRKSIMAGVGLCYEWIIVDNGSTKVSALAELDAIHENNEALVVYNPRNEWFTKGCNIGIMQSKGEVVLLLNPDTVITPDAIPRMLSVIERREAAVVGSVLVNEKDLVVHAGASGPGDHDAKGLPYDPKAPWAQERPWDGFVTGACLMIPRFWLDQVGGLLPETHPHYHSDRELCRLVASLGGSIWMSDAKIVHTVGASGL